MTFVIARKLPDRIAILSDTMITDRDGARPNILPGRMKAIVVAPLVSVAYAGFAGPALAAIRRFRSALNAGQDSEEARTVLVAATAEHPDELDFLIASHERGPDLRRVWNGRVSGDLDQSVIGDTSLLKPLNTAEERWAAREYPAELAEHAAMGRFTGAFHDLFEGVQIAAGVGGVPIILQASVYGHTYLSHGGVRNWDHINLATGLTPEHLAHRASGMTEWRYNVYSTALRGAPVVGLLLETIGVGFIYSPLRYDDPIQLAFPRPPRPGGPEAKELHEAFNRRVQEEIAAVGGAFPEPAEPLWKPAEEQRCAIGPLE
jgi:hypothetical protein